MYYNPNASVRLTGSPGYELESQFDDMLYGCELIQDHYWMSEKKKATFDFKVFTKQYHDSFLIDVVGSQYKYKSIQLYTHHKDWLELLDYAKEQGIRQCYLAYKLYEIERYGFSNWRFLRITDKLPNGNLYISRARAKASRTYEYLFADKRNIKTKLADKVKHKYALREKARPST